MADDLVVEQEGAVLTVTFDRPRQHNAMTFAMYEGLYDACERADDDGDVRAMVLRGAGGKSFVSGTDIAQFRDFADGKDGVEYERRIARVVNRLEDVTVPTLAAVRGFCMGGGLAIAAVCDLRVASTTARFGAPIARTLGNCLSANSVSVLVSRLGAPRALDVLLRARVLTADEALAAGFVAEVCDDDAVDATVEDILTTLLAHAPLTMWAAKTAVSRLRRASLPDDADLIERTFGSDDFRRAVRSFATKEKVAWTGR